jgi:hypothetical protein
MGQVSTSHGTRQLQSASLLLSLRFWIPAAAAIAVAFRVKRHKPVTSNHARELTLISSEGHTGPAREHSKLLAQERSTVPTVKALQSAIASFAWLNHIASTVDT